jgi:hypothetical protein
MNKNIINKIMERKDSYESEIAMLKKERDAFKHFFEESPRNFEEFINTMILDDSLYTNEEMYFLLKEYLTEENEQIITLPTFMVAYRVGMFADLKNFYVGAVLRVLDKICLVSNGRIYSREEIECFKEYCKNKPYERYEFSGDVEKYNEEYEEFKRNKNK